MGVKVTLIVQLELPARLVPHVFVSPKSPDAAMEVIVSALALLFARVTGCDALVVVTSWPPNVRPLGDTVTAEVVPVPESVTVCVAAFPYAV